MKIKLNDREQTIRLDSESSGDAFMLGQIYQRTKNSQWHSDNYERVLILPVAEVLTLLIGRHQ